MKKFIAAIFLLLGIIFIFSRFTELQEIVDVLRKGKPGFILLGIGAELLWLLVMGATVQAIYKLLGVNKKLLPVTHLITSVNFVNLIAPSAGVGGLAVLYNDAQRNGHSSARITVGSVIFLIFDYVGLLGAILVGMVILAFRNSLHVTEILAYTLFVALTGVLATLLILASGSRERLALVLAWLSQGINRLIKPIRKKEWLTGERVRAFADDLSDGMQAVKKVRRGWLIPAVFVLLNKTILIGILGLMCLAFDNPIGIDNLIAGFSIGYLFVIVSPTPAGVGIVEGVLTLSLSNLGIPLEAAAIITLAFRGITFWFPLGLGLIAFRSIPK